MVLAVLLATLFVPKLPAGELFQACAQYGQDDRMAVPTGLLGQAAPVAVAIPRHALGRPVPTLGQRFRLCPDEPLAGEPSLGVCTGTLVAPDLLLTASHCVRNRVQCESVVWTFDRTGGPVSPAQAVGCRELVAVDRGLDLSLVRLESSQERLPLPIPADLSAPRSVYLLGSSLGLSLMVAGDAPLRVRGEAEWRAPLDAFQGNSGSPVFGADDQRWVGVLVAGADDFEWDAERHCRRTRVYGEDSVGERVVPLSALPESFLVHLK